MSVAHTAKTSPAFLQLVSHCGERERMYYMNVCLVPGCVPTGLGSASRADEVYGEKRPLTGWFFSKSKRKSSAGPASAGSMGPCRFAAVATPLIAHHVTVKA